MSVIKLLTADGRILDEDHGLVFKGVRISYDGPRTLEFSRDVRFDEGDIFSNGDKIALVVDGQTVFTGWILDHDPSLESMERIDYRAAGPRAKLGGVTHIRNETANVIYNAEDEDANPDSTTDWTYAQIFDDVVAGVSNEIIAAVTGTELMTAVAPEVSFVSMSIDECLRYIVEKAGKFGFYITPSRELKVVDLSATTEKNVYIGEIGQRVGDHDEYDVARANLNWSISSCKTKCTIEGAREREEGYINLVPDWNPALEASWSWNYGYITPDEADALREAENIEGNRAHVFRRYKISGVSTARIMDYLISDDDKRPFTEWQGKSDKWIQLGSWIDLEQGIIMFPRAIYHKRTKDAGSAASTTIREAAPARLKCVLEKEPLKAVFGPTGTAYNKGLRNEIYIIDNSLVKENVPRPDETVARDDMARFTTIAEHLLSPVKDEAVTGTITLDGLDMGWTLEYKANMQNTAGGKWASLGASILSITYQLGVPDFTVLQVSSSHYLGAGPDYAELKRRMLVAQKLNKIEKKTSSGRAFGETAGGGDTLIYMKGDDELDQDSSEGEWDESETSQLIKNMTLTELTEYIQELFNRNILTMPTHSHTSLTEGGPAYAESGSALL